MVVFLGVDLGYGRVHAVAVTEDGQILAESTVPWTGHGRSVEGVSQEEWEGEPEVWWQAVMDSLKSVLDQVDPNARMHVKGIGLCAMSNTLLLLDEDRRPVRPAIMHGDFRARDQAKMANDAAWRTLKKVGIRFEADHTLPKLLWVREHEEERFDKGCLLAHAADYILGRLTDIWGVCDFNNALETGYNTLERRWPAYLLARLHVPRHILPKVVAPGECLGNLKQEWAKTLGLSGEVRVVAGTTRRVAGLLASGASVPGDWCSALGKKLVIQGILEERLNDPESRFYHHLHPQGWWICEGSSSVGGECLDVKFKGMNLNQLDLEVQRWIPTDMVIYPLMREGERLPFKNSEAIGFMAGKANSDGHLFAGYLEGVALVEKWAFDIVSELNCPLKDRIYVVGGGTRSQPWLKIRASSLKKTLLKARFPEPCLGAAILAASSFHGGDVSSMCRSMAPIEEEILPDLELSREYARRYGKLRKACDAIGYG